MLSAAAVLAVAVASQAVSAGQAKLPASSRVHLIRSTSGSRGTQEGQRFLIEDPRSVFHAGKDRQILVLFEWQGPTGSHQCEATWKDPDGKAVFTSRSDIVARGPRFGAYWGLSLPDTVATGTWSIEASVDGEAAGVHAFQLVSAPPDPTAPPSRRALGVRELYQRGLTTTLTVAIVDAAGRPVSTVSGLLLAPELVLVPFSPLNGARSARASLPDGRRLETDAVAALDRKGDWVLLRLPEAGGQPATRAPAAPAVGDPCFFMALQDDGSRVIVESSFVGRSATDDLVVPHYTEVGTSGSPVLNDHGEILGFLVAPFALAGADRLDLTLLGSGALRGSTSGTRVRALPAVPQATATARTLADLERAGEFVHPLAKTVHIVSGVLGTGIAEDKGIPFAVGQRFRFSRVDGRCVVFVTWSPRDKQQAPPSSRWPAATVPRRPPSRCVAPTRRSSSSTGGIRTCCAGTWKRQLQARASHSGTRSRTKTGFRGSPAAGTSASTSRTA